MIVSRITAEILGSMPRAVRAALRLSEGDEVAYEIHGDRVVLTKVGTVPTDDPFHTFDEWDDEADRKAYADL